MENKVLPDITVVNNYKTKRAVRLRVEPMNKKNPVAVGVAEVPNVANFSSLRTVGLSDMDVSEVHQVVAQSGGEEARSEVTVTEDGFPDSQEITVNIRRTGELEVHVSVA